MADSGQWQIEGLAKDHDRSSFSSGEQALDLFIKQQARQQQEKGFNRTFVAVEKANKRVIGFYSLSACHIPMTQLSEEQKKNLPRYDSVPGILLGRLAVDQSMRGKGLGAFLFRHAAFQVMQIAKLAGVAVLAVDAKNDDAKKFYLKLGFKEFEGQPMRLFLSVEIITKAFEST